MSDRGPDVCGMRYGFVMPFGDAAEIAEAAALAEAAGWDALFVWEAIWGVDAWVGLTAAAMRTSTLRLGTMLTPVPRIRPWDLASRVRHPRPALRRPGDPRRGARRPARGLDRVRARRGPPGHGSSGSTRLAIYAGLTRGQPFAYDGRHYRVTPDRLHGSRTRRSSDRIRRCGWWGAWRVGAPTAALAGAGGALAGLAAPGRRRRLARQPAPPRQLATMLALVRAAARRIGLPWPGRRMRRG